MDDPVDPASPAAAWAAAAAAAWWCAWSMPTGPPGPPPTVRSSKDPADPQGFPSLTRTGTATRRGELWEAYKEANCQFFMSPKFAKMHQHIS